MNSKKQDELKENNQPSAAAAITVINSVSDDLMKLGCPIIVIEHCVDCKNHNWNNRHDEAKYKSMAMQLASEIKGKVDDCVILVNQIPNSLIFSDIY